MAINKVVYGADTLIDLSEDTVTENDVLSGATFHSADGEQRTGTVVTAPINDTGVSSNEVWSSYKTYSEIDKWHSVNGEKQVITATTTGVQTITFSGTQTNYAYKLYANTSDGSLVEVKSCSFTKTGGGGSIGSDGSVENYDTGTLTYTVDVKLAGTQFALRRIKV